MNDTDIKALIRQELPNILQSDKSFRLVIQEMLQNSFADKQQTEDRFDKMFAELRTLREESEQRWETQQAEIRKLREESEQRWEENKQRWEAQQAENKKLREEAQQRWEAQQAENRKIWEEHKKFNQKYNSNIGALGARWGIQTEQSFRNALKSILEESFDVQVLNINDYDDEGIVFGRPDQVELDVIIKNGLLIICEIKSSMSKSDMYSFERKVRFYEKRHNRQANRMLVISPMVDPYARPVAEKLGIELYSYAQDTKLD